MTILSQNAFNVSRDPGNFTVSFEAFPPMSPKGQEKLLEVAHDLEEFAPEFFSVTYGAGGGTQQRTLDTLSDIAEKTSHNLAGHLTCVGATRQQTNAVAEKYRSMGVNRIVALRGDAPEGQDHYQPHPGGYKNAADLVAGLKELGGFDISVGAYPESHPDSPSRAADLDNLQAKFAAGADRAITQFFFDNHVFYDFMDEAEDHGITGPIVPGILLIHDFWKVKRFAKLCQTDVPDWLEARFAGLEDDPAAQQLVSVSIAVEQVLDMAANGVRHFHFYTMNKSDLAVAVCRSLGLKPSKELRSVA
ncbi:MAG TPA: methylenetetrahydrofolate reductase [NAD(P)H] [Rhizobiales bacterium]|nr:methylenetetrahydrofolate reductase [NAD(P)H] [Hyphomicrobiales bacterium]